MSAGRFRCFVVHVTVAVLAFAGIAVPAAAADPEAIARLADAISVGLHRHYGTAEQREAAVGRIYGVPLSPDKVAFASQTMRDILFEPTASTYFAKLLAPIIPRDLPAAELAAAVLDEGTVLLQWRGLARLSSERQAEFLAHTLAVARSLTPAKCKAAFLGQLSSRESVALERRYLAGLPIARFEAVTRLYRDAAKAELDGYPDPRVISAEQAGLAKSAHALMATDRWVAAGFSRDTVVAATSNSAGAEPQDVCDVMSIAAEAMLGLDEPYRAWALVRFIQSLQ